MSTTKISATRVKKFTAFDMDGTIVDLYGVSDWLKHLEDESTFPFDTASPLINIEGFKYYLEELHRKNHHLAIISWTPKDASDSYCKAVRKAKVEWLKKYDLLKYFDEIHIVAYGTPKHRIAVKRRKYDYYSYGIFDDDTTVRDKWERKTLSPTKIFNKHPALSVSEFQLRSNCEFHALLKKSATPTI